MKKSTAAVSLRLSLKGIAAEVLYAGGVAAALMLIGALVAAVTA